MKIDLPSKVEVRTKKELRELLEIATKEEKYELCSLIQEALINYEQFINELINVTDLSQM